MELKFKPLEISSTVIKDCERMSLTISHPRTDGSKGHNLLFSMEEDKYEFTLDGYPLAFYINRNQAMYLINFLKSFVNELDIDTSLED